VAGEDDAVRIAEEQGRTVFGLLVIVPPGQSRQVAFVYDLPPLEHVRGYELLVQKQAGLPEAKLHVSVRGAGRVLTCHGCSSGVHVHNGDVSCNLVGDTRIVWGDTRAWWGQVEPSYSVLARGLLLLGASVFLARARRRSGSVEKTG